ncbi:hypothetical protein AB1Y20_017532 [Prymnesium parvum]|uniref:Uncharacterized protein n=1 Tax=Prymnesium parvum TaxID=97485 RepID=A0AB34JKT7_PRYPA
MADVLTRCGVGPALERCVMAMHEQRERVEEACWTVGPVRRLQKALQLVTSLNQDEDPERLAEQLVDAQAQIRTLQDALESTLVKLTLAEKEAVMYQSALRWRATADKNKALVVATERPGMRKDPSGVASDFGFFKQKKRTSASNVSASGGGDQPAVPNRRLSREGSGLFAARGPPRLSEGKERSPNAKAEQSIPVQPVCQPSKNKTIFDVVESEPLVNFRGLLAKVLAMRERGEYDDSLMHRYNDALVLLPDDNLDLVYKVFTHVYTGEHSKEELKWIGIQRTSEVVHGFIEMQTMKVGALLDTPQVHRAKLLEKERAKAREKQARAEREAEKRLKEAEILQKLRIADRLAYDACLPMAKQWAEGEGDEKLVRRFQRRKELQLLVMTPEKMKRAIPHVEWQQMMTSGLDRDEVRALSHCLRQPGVPAQAAPFIELLRTRIFSFGEELLAVDLARGSPSESTVGLQPPPPVVMKPSPPAPLPPPPIVKSSSKGVDELNKAMERRKEQVSAIERGDIKGIDPRAAREAEMQAKKAAMLKGKSSNRVYGMFSLRTKSRAKRAPDGQASEPESHGVNHSTQPATRPIEDNNIPNLSA